MTSRRNLHPILGTRPLHAPAVCTGRLLSFWFQRFNTFIWHGTLPTVPCRVTILPEDRVAEYRPADRSIHVDPIKCCTRFEILSALLHEMLHLHQDTAGHVGDWHSPAFHIAAADLRALTGLDP